MLNFDAETLAKLRIIRTPNVGAVTYRRVMLRYLKAERVVAEWAQIGKANQPLCGRDMVLRELETVARAGGWMMLWGDDDYPPQLAELPDAPLALTGLGKKQALLGRQVAMVGNRSASAAGLVWSREVARELAKAGVTVTSGLARGIDTAAHEGALESGGLTVAVVAGGVDHIYPPENATLRTRIIGQGCVVSEQPWGMAPTAKLFPRRNRIIAGLSIGVVVSEASRHSGSLITAEHALDYGREVWAVPGSPADTRSGGPNWLLKNGAALVEHAQDILGQLPYTPAPYVKRTVQNTLFDVEEPLIPEEPLLFGQPESETGFKRIFELLGASPISADELVRLSGLEGADVSMQLTELELDGHAIREADGRWRRA